MLLWRQEPIPEGAIELTVLDVGQGLAAVVRTRSHALVYDSGPSFRSGTDAGSLVVVPYLLARGIRHVDRLVVSHGDDDHSGGAASLVDVYPETRVLGSDSAAAKLSGIEPCSAGQAWGWDGVEFRILHPGNDREWDGNNDSCVLIVRTGAGTVLLAGDIEAPAEAQLVDAPGDLRADIIVAPHHRSATSSTPGFVAAVGPSLVVFSAGFRNRWGFPVNEVVQRWRDVGARTISTAHSGAVTVEIDPRNGISLPSSHRVAARRHWNAP
jgi:competence protein ComEC